MAKIILEDLTPKETGNESDTLRDAMAKVRREFLQEIYQCRPLHRPQAAAARTTPADVHTSAPPDTTTLGQTSLL